MKLLHKILPALLVGSALSGCTNLDEELFDTVGTDNYYHTALDVKRVVYRPFEHAYWSVTNYHTAQELTADQLITPQRDSWWDDSGVWRMLQYHTYDAYAPYLTHIGGMWVSGYQGVGECNFVIHELERLDPADFGLSQTDFNNFIAQARALRAWFYIRLFDAFRNIPIWTDFGESLPGDIYQAPPAQTFQFIESELKACLTLIQQKQALGTQAGIQGQWTTAGVAALLVRLYLNAEAWGMGDRYDDCAYYAQKILKGDYGPYQVADRWDAIFDWNNDTCDEMIFGFPSAGGYTYWGYQQETHWFTVPHNSNLYFGDIKCKAGTHNSQYACSPSYDTNGNLYNFELGMTVQKFRKYPSDYRLKMYKNLGNSKREGMFVYGYLEYEDGGTTKRLQATGQNYTIYIRDAVGQFHDTAPDRWPGGNSDLSSGDHNSGWHFAKYPFYPDGDPGQLESDWAEIRLPEVIYSLAECKLRRGHTDEAAILLNSVRRRNYPSEDWPTVLYAPEGKASLDMNEMLDEWGREFLAEGRRRTDLIRFGKFSSGRWWDKTPDSDDHYKLFPLTVSAVLNTNSNMIQNPGY